MRPAPLVLPFAIGAAAAASSCSGGAPAAPAPSAEVDPLIGTGGLGFTVGSIPPGPALPFGMARPGPDTSTLGGAPDFSHCAGYWYEDTEIRGFSQLHAAGTGVPDYGVLLVMPVLDLDPGPVFEARWSQRLDHRREHASPGAYGVELAPSGISVELGATLRTSVYRITFPASAPAAEASLVVDLAHGLGGVTLESELRLDPAGRELSGWLLHAGALASPDAYRVFFVLRFDAPLTSFETYSRGERSPGSTAAAGPAIGAILSFGSGLQAPVNLQLGLSFVDLAGARANLEEEWVEFDLDRARAQARAAWDEALSVVEIEGGTEEHRRRFYTALYHAQLMPTWFSDTDGRHRGLDGEIHPAAGYSHFTDFSLWDTFRTFHPLITLLDPARAEDFARSLVAMTEESGRVPKWPLATVETDTMIGYHGETVLIDGWQKGVRGFDGEALYAILRAGAFPVEGPAEGRRRDCATPYLELGWCPADQEGGSASKTLENAFSDFMLARLALDLGHMDDAAELDRRAGSWRALINEHGLIQGRARDGTFDPGFREELFSDEFVEGNSRQWSVFVPHDVPGLARAAGEERFLAFLTDLFESAAAAEKGVFPDLHYWHGNEPDIHAAYMFAELGHPELTAKWVRWIIDHRYAASPAGLDGNDDGGTLSAWYVFSALGFFPKVGEGRYVLGIPLFPRAVLHLPGEVTFTVRAEGWSERATEVVEVRLNGAPKGGPFLTHEEVTRGGELTFVLAEP